MELFFFWLLFAIAVGIGASGRGRSGFGWFLLAMVISPLIAFVLLVLLPSNSATTVVVAGESAVTPETHVKCPDCREFVMRDARKCKHCGTHLVPQ